MYTALGAAMAVAAAAALALAAASGAHAQSGSAEYVVDTGRLIIHLGSPYDSHSIFLSRIQITDGEGIVTPQVREFARARSDQIHLQMSQQSRDAIEAMRDPVVIVGEGAVSRNGVPASEFEVPLLGVIRMGAVFPEERLDAAAVAALSAEHFNEALERYGKPWRLDMVVKSNDNIQISLLELEKEGIAVAVGVEGITHAKEVLGVDMVTLACCSAYTSYDNLGVGAASFALIPDADEPLPAILAAMSRDGINRIIPVYHQDNRQIQPQVDYLAHAVVDAGVQYDDNTSAGDIAYRIAQLVTPNIIENPGVKLGILLTDTADAARILEAASLDRSLTRAKWFGLEPDPAITENEAAAAFAHEVGYRAPQSGGVHNAMTVSIDSLVYEITSEEPDPHVRNAYDAVQLGGRMLLGDADLYGLETQTISDLEKLTAEIAPGVPGISRGYGGYAGYAGLGEHGGLEAATLDIMSVRGDQWIRSGVYGHPSQEPAGAINLGGKILPAVRYSAGDPFVEGVIPVGLLVSGYDAYASGAAAQMGLAALEGHYGLILHDAKDGAVPEAMARFDAMGLPVVLVHASDLQTFEASTYAQANEMIVIGTASAARVLASPGDGTFRTMPSDALQARALAAIMERDGIKGVVAVYPDAPGATLLLEDVADAFVGEVDDSNSYPEDAPSDVMLQVAASVREMASRYGNEGTAILVAGREGAAGLVADAPYAAKNVRWYGTWEAAGSRQIIEDAADAAEQVKFSATAPALSGGGPAAILIDATLSLHPDQLPAHAASLFEASGIAGAMMSADLYGASDGSSGFGTLEEGVLYVDHDASILQALLPEFVGVASSLRDHDGLDGNGDLNPSGYDVWRLDDSGWIRPATYDMTHGYLEMIPVGVLAPLSGPDTIRGMQQVWAAHLAISAQNAILESDSKNWRFVQRPADTASHPSVSLDAASALRDSGVDLLLGPPDSASLGSTGILAILGGMAQISCCADLLDTSHNNTSTLASSAYHQADALAQLVLDDGISALLVMQNGDADAAAYDKLLVDALESRLNGTIIRSHYHSNQTLDEATGAAASLLEGLVAAHGELSVGVLLPYGDDAAGILASSLNSRILQSVGWYGTSGDGRLPPILHDYNALAAASFTGFSVPAPAIPDSNDAKTLGSAIYSSTGFTPASDSYLMYDAATLLAGAVYLLDGQTHAAAVSEMSRLLSEGSAGLSGPLALDANGQRTQMHHDVWRLVIDSWEVVRQYKTVLPDAG